MVDAKCEYSDKFSDKIIRDKKIGLDDKDDCSIPIIVSQFISSLFVSSIIVVAVSIDDKPNNVEADNGIFCCTIRNIFVFCNEEHSSNTREQNLYDSVNCCTELVVVVDVEDGNNDSNETLFPLVPVVDGISDGIIFDRRGLTVVYLAVLSLVLLRSC